MLVAAATALRLTAASLALFGHNFVVGVCREPPFRAAILEQ
jgi:hypothetical protein